MIGFSSVTYNVLEGGSVDLTIMKIGDSQFPLEVTVSASGVTATGMPFRSL